MSKKSDHMDPLVSILIPTFNRSESCIKAIYSALLQDHLNIEVIVSDNSTDHNTRIEVEKILDSRVKYFKNSENFGPILNWRRALHLAEGKYCVIMPDDDIFLNPFYVSDAVKIMEAGKYAMVIPDCILSFPQRSLVATSGCSGAVNGREFLNNECRIPHIGNMFIRAHALELNAFRSNDILWSDIELWWKILWRNSVYCYALPSILYSFHENNIVNNMNKSQLIKNSEFVSECFGEFGEDLVAKMLLQHLKMVEKITGQVDKEFIILSARLNNISHKFFWIYWSFSLYILKKLMKRGMRLSLRIFR